MNEHSKEDKKKGYNWDLKYGFGKCTPNWLQGCLSPKVAAFWICWFAVVQGKSISIIGIYYRKN